MKKTIILFVAILTLKLGLQYLLINPAYDLHRDEYLHLDQGRHLAWGYISVPPMTSWVSYLINLLGGSVFWVKFFPALFGTLTIIIVLKIVEELGGKLFALLLAALATLFSVILRINILYQPNSSDIFFWTLTYFTVIKYVNSNNSRWLYVTALAVGFGVLSKYNIIFLIIGLLAGILISQRTVFKERRLYFAVIIAFIIVLPNLLWQINHHFPTFHQLNELTRTQLVNVNRNDFIKDQLLFFSNSIFIIIAAIVGFFAYPPFRKYRFVFWSYFIAISLYFILKAKSYYAIGLYPVLLAFGSVYIEKLLEKGWKRFLKPVAIILVLALCMPMVLLGFPIKSPSAIESNNRIYKNFGLLRWEDGKDHSLPQDFADMIGWSDLARQTDSAYSELTEKENTLVICDNYGEAGAINYYSKFRDINAVSFNADYINWIPLTKNIKNVILVKEVNDDDTTRTKEKPLFDSVALIGRNNNRYSRELGTRIFLLKRARVNINPILAKEIEKHKNR
jgi:Dolichyl-phosphate-mannose-protein mannosyltransferase